ncbi:acyltransferase domain-containing protein [Microbispora sp. H10830]|uniref:acyltransferase domain-containing protein n=1 Tax=Microbispora sp. H10830 TaxID=2729109 RepID=UPI0015FEE030|nr:acyltransferase domain-containing protein [Microbispora sp. H10830]
MTAPKPVALLLPGQGSQQALMAAGLYGHEEVFTEAMDEVFAAFEDQGPRLRDDWLAARPQVSIDHMTRSQPLLFAVDYALGRLAGSWERPAALLGHSIGEMAAAVLGGVFDLADAVRLLRERVRSLSGAVPGGMLVVAASVREVEPFLRSDVVVGAINAPRQTVLAGAEAPLLAVEEALRDNAFTCRRVPATCPFHSPLLAFSVAGAERAFAAVPARPPSIPVYSGYTAAVLTAEQVAAPAFWASHPVAPVLFRPALDALLASGDFLLVEAGPGQGLASLARRHPAVRPGGSEVVAMSPARAGDPRADRDVVRAAMRRIRATTRA